MEQNTFIGELETLVQHEDALTVSREVNELKTRFEDYILEEERKEQVAQLEAQERGETYEPKDFKPLKEAFYDVFNVYKERRKAVIETKNAEESENLRRKKFLLTKLQDVIQNEENIGAAFGTYKEIHDEWKKIGNIPREKREDIQKEYSRLLELFFYNMKIYRELKDHDLKRNHQLKAEIVKQLEELKNVASIKDLEITLKRLQNEWDEIGPVTNDDWEALKNRYWETVRALYEKVTHYYDERRTSLQENLNKKKELLQEVTTYVGEAIAADSVKAWEDATEKLLKFQESWKGIGFGPRKENEEIWSAFRAQSDVFFEKKKAFYATIQDKFAVVADAKRKIIESAKVLKESSEWKDTSEKLIRLQKEWKNVGHAGQKLEQKLWTEFRAVCDSFFNARQKHFEEQDKALETNLLAKQEIIKNLQAYAPSDDKQKSLADLREFTNAFNAVGKVPMKEKDTIYHAYKSAIDQHYGKLKLEAGEKDRVMFEVRLETLKGSPDAGKLLSKERFDIRQQIDKLKSDMLQYENNLGFFAKSKGADVLRKEVESKIDASKAKIETLIKKMKQIPNE